MVRSILNQRCTTIIATVLAGFLNTCTATAQTTYNYASSATTLANWHDSSVWNPTGVPNAPGDGAIFVQPLVTPSGTLSINLQSSDATVGSIVVDNAGFANTDNFNIETAGGKLIFQSSSGPATYTETAGTADNPSPARRTNVNAPITLLSDFVVTQDNIPGLNTGTVFSNRIDGASNLTFTKEGAGNLQLNYSFPLEVGEGFQGQYIINEGGLRLIGAPGIVKATGITVNAGGQLQLGQNNSIPVPDWSMANGSVLNLNGAGKASGSAADGALRFQLNGGVTSTFHNPVNLQSDSVIAVQPAGNTGVLDNVVSGNGGLTKFGGGTLILSSSINSYTGNTSVLPGGPLSITTPFLADSADLFLSTGSVMDVNFSGTDDIRSFYIDGEPQAVGVWGATGNLAADFQTDLITGTGLLNVTALPGLDGDYNGDGIVDAADYVIWRKNPDGHGGDPDGYDAWRGNFGATLGEGGVVASFSAAVAEPNALSIAMLMLLPFGGKRQRRSVSKSVNVLAIGYWRG